MSLKRYMNTKEMDPEKRFIWILFLIVCLILLIISVVIGSSQGDNISDFIVGLMITSILLLPIGFSKVFGNPFYNQNKDENYIDIQDGILAYGAYKYITHKKKRLGIKVI